MTVRVSSCRLITKMRFVTGLMATSWGRAPVGAVAMMVSVSSSMTEILSVYWLATYTSPVSAFTPSAIGHSSAWGVPGVVLGGVAPGVAAGLAAGLGAGLAAGLAASRVAVAVAVAPGVASSSSPSPQPDSATTSAVARPRTANAHRAERLLLSALGHIVHLPVGGGQRATLLPG